MIDKIEFEPEAMHVNTKYNVVTLLSCCTVMAVVCHQLASADSKQDNSAPEDTENHPATSKRLPKDKSFMTELDLEHLYEQWEESDDEKLPPDELEPHKRPAPRVKLPISEDGRPLGSPEELMIASKKGKTVMAFVTVANNPTREDTELFTQRWQVGLTNAHIKCERFVIADDRAIFVFEDGSLAYEAKNYLLEQPELKEYSIDNKVWQGKGYPVEYPNQPTQPQQQ